MQKVFEFSHTNVYIKSDVIYGNMVDIRLASSNGRKRTIVNVNNVHFGNHFVIIAGPCAIEDLDGLLATARAVKAAGADALRGGAFKARSSPYAFQGLGENGLKMLAKARDETGLPIVTEVVDPRDVALVSKYADMLQIGTRNMQNHPLLRECGRAGKPVLLKRGMQATLAEWLQSAEYVMAEGNEDVVLCERGIRTHETYTRNTLDLSAVPAMRELTHLPVIVDPSHGTGRSSLVAPMTLAAVAAGADGAMLEVHADPSKSVSDADQALTHVEFAELVKRVRALERHQRGAGTS
jgi:3-deoxy-7-phosphoheptulonate synthase